MLPHAFSFVEYEVLTALVMKSSVSWDITPCIPSKVNLHSNEHDSSVFSVESIR
jgi:hypothetical protein